MQQQSIGQFIRFSRRMVDLSQEELGHLVGVGKVTISNIENGKTKSDFVLIEKILILLREKGAPQFDLYSTTAT